MPTVKLAQSVQVRLNGSGNGTAQLGPLTAMETWHPDNVHVSAATAVNEATCSVFVGPDTGQPNFRDATFSGSTGDSTDKCNADVITKGSYIFAVWSGGDANILATLNVTGSRDV